MIRSARYIEVFEVECYHHHGVVEVPVSTVRTGRALCPRCGATLALEWRAGEHDDETPCASLPVGRGCVESAAVDTEVQR